MKNFLITIGIIIVILAAVGCVMGDSLIINHELEKPIPLEDVKRIIDDYIDNNSFENYISSCINEKEDAIIVVLKDNDTKKQDEFIYEVFSHTTGSKYIQNIKNNSLIKFEKNEI